MKKTIAALACALIGPLAFAQTSTKSTEKTTTAQPTTTTEATTTYTAGTVTTYKPGKTILIQSNLGPVSFGLGAAARIVNGAGQVVTSALTPGQRVRVYYTGTGGTRMVDHVIVEVQALRVILSVSCKDQPPAGPFPAATVIFGVASGLIKASKRNARCKQPGKVNSTKEDT